MDRRLLGPKWIVAHLSVGVLAASFITLGLWQLDRLEERRETNRTGSERFSMEPVPFETIEDEDPESIEYRRVTVVGRALSTSEVLVRSQVHLGTAGYHLIVPISHRGDAGVLVNRGWVPLGTEVGTTHHGQDLSMWLKVEGWIHLTQERPAIGPQDPPDGILSVMSRVDIERVQQQTDPSVDIADVYIVEIGEWGSEPPFQVEPPDFADEGPHLVYAVQWFGFTAVLAVGYVFLARRRLSTQP